MSNMGKFLEFRIKLTGLTKDHFLIKSVPQTLWRKPTHIF